MVLYKPSNPQRLGKIPLNELLTVEEFFEEHLDLILRYVGINITVKIRLFDTCDTFIPNYDLFEKFLLKSIELLRNAIYLEGGSLFIQVYPFMYGGLAVSTRAIGNLRPGTVIGMNLLISREIISLTPLTKRSGSEIIIISQ